MSAASPASSSYGRDRSVVSNHTSVTLLEEPEGISSIADLQLEHLCVGCGSCSSVCPNSAVKMTLRDGIRYLPEVDRTLCRACGACVRVCPGVDLDFWGIPAMALYSEGDPTSYNRCYTGYSTNSRRRYDSSSGGLVTELAEFLLEKGIVEGIIVTGTREDNPLETDVFLATSKEDIENCAGSKYAPVSLNHRLKELTDELNGNIAIIGLPCHIKGLDRLLRELPDLCEKVAFRIGLFCGGCPTNLYTKYLIRTHGLVFQDVTEIRHRGQGWPGLLQIRLRSGEIVSKPYNDSYCFTLKSFFIPLRCRMCLDLFSSRADISFGDAWLPDIVRNDSQGTSLVVIRNRELQTLIDTMVEENRIRLQDIETSEVLRSQGYYTYKTRTVGSALRLFWIVNRTSGRIDKSLISDTGVLQYSLFFVLHLLGSAHRARFQYHTIRLIARIIEMAKRVRAKLKSRTMLSNRWHRR